MQLLPGVDNPGRGEASVMPEIGGFVQDFAPADGIASDLFFIVALAGLTTTAWSGSIAWAPLERRNRLLFGREFCQHFPVTITLAVFADKDSFLLKAYSEPFYCGDGFPDCLLQVFLGDTRILCDGF